MDGGAPFPTREPWPDATDREHFVVSREEGRGRRAGGRTPEIHHARLCLAPPDTRDRREPGSMHRPGDTHEDVAESEQAIAHVEILSVFGVSEVARPGVGASRGPFAPSFETR
jgi:hypothetical protein